MDRDWSSDVCSSDLIPFYLQDHRRNPFDDIADLNTPQGEATALNQQWWKIESGIVALTVNNRTKAFTAKALQMYRGGLYELAMDCFNHSALCKHERIGSNCYTNDIFVYTLLLQTDIHKDEYFHVNLRHGWFAMKGLPIWGDNYQYGNHWWPLNFSPSSRNDSLLTNFNIGAYVFHHFGTHQKGALSMQHKRGASDAWRLVTEPGEYKNSLHKFLGDY
jgi:hypothetical protein